jgi:hypothetical protein
LWSIGRFDLRLGEKEFWSLTPKLFNLLLERKEAADRQEFLRSGIIAAAVVNFSMCHPDKPVSPTDFVPGYKKKNFDLRDMDPKEQAKYIRNMFSKKVFNRK